MSNSTELNDRGVFHLEERCEGCNGLQTFEAGAICQVLHQGYLVYVILNCSTCGLATRMQPEALTRRLTVAGRFAQALVAANPVLAQGVWHVNTDTMSATPATDSVSDCFVAAAA